MGGVNAHKSLCFGIYHDYSNQTTNQTTTKELREPTHELWAAYWEEITSHKAMERAVNTLYTYRYKKGEEKTPKPHPIFSYSPGCACTAREQEEAELITDMFLKVSDERMQKLLETEKLIEALKDFLAGDLKANPNLCHFSVPKELVGGY